MVCTWETTCFSVKGTFDLSDEGFRLRAASLMVRALYTAGFCGESPEEKVQTVTGVFSHFDPQVIPKRFKQQQRRSESNSYENEPRSCENMLDYF